MSLQIDTYLLFIFLFDVVVYPNYLTFSFNQKPLIVYMIGFWFKEIVK